MLQEEFFCDQCKNSFTSASLLLKHFAQHATTKLKKELNILQIYENNSPSENNIDNTNDDNLIKYLMSIERSNKSQQNFEKITLVRKDEMNFRCDICNLGFRKKIVLRKHKKNVHDVLIGIPDLTPISQIKKS